MMLCTSILCGGSGIIMYVFLSGFWVGFYLKGRHRQGNRPASRVGRLCERREGPHLHLSGWVPWRLCPPLHAVLLIVCSRIKINNYFGRDRLTTRRSYNTVGRIFMQVSELFYFLRTYNCLEYKQSIIIKMKTKEYRFIWYKKIIMKILYLALLGLVLQFGLFLRTVPYPGAGHILYQTS